MITSLCEAETKQKHCFILKVKKGSFICKEVKLRFTRPFVLRTIELKNTGVPPRSEAIEKYVKEALNQVIGQAEKEQEDIQNAKGDLAAIPDELKLPHIRLRVDYAGGFAVLAPRIFARHTEGRVANPQDCVLFFKSNKYQPRGAT